MRELTCFNRQVSYDEYIVIERETRRTETSKYPEEEKETSIFQVAASERERGQTSWKQEGLRTTKKGTESIVEESWKAPAQRVKLP